ncbi:putative regulator of Ras-like GTPase activity (Roadblock/LC7/MglB family) [Streptomyces sp. Amel2xB2]|uniref:Dynein regulation protein LC7 n=1 Tax=Streptomyces nanshensis TaxID=518642 RepID=A0A1E7L396_9ACTN|nr:MULTISPECIES: roadblock/LC7 domain-containing protein [Streptomyces]OEV10676.1 dynein regulation protein LC7 [Streptomyces nanshensis]RAJ71325.1 putative regulator of Ras-like GTPase activity (Roadblock/LC7/MglB family) [Streptomyces sp. Amel2xB2]
MTEQSPVYEKLNWLLDGLLDRVPDTLHVIVLSQDGLLLARSRDVSKDDADHMSALASGLHSLSMGAARRFHGGRVRQTVIEMENVLLLITAGGDGSRLALLANENVDAGMAAYEMAKVVQQVGAHLSAAPRLEVAAGDQSR